MDLDPDVAKWQASQRAANAAARKALLAKVLPVVVVVALLGGIFGAVHWNDVRRREAIERQLADEAKIPVPQTKIDEAKTVLKRAIAARASKDEARGSIVAAAYRELEPSAKGAPCPATLGALAPTDLLRRTSFTLLDAKTGPNWSSRRTSELESELPMVDLRVKDKVGSGVALGDQLVATATRLASEVEPPVDFQLVVTEHVEPTVGGATFLPGVLRGVLLAYDYEKRTVVCGARVSGTNSSSVSVVTADPVLGPESAVGKISGDLLHNTLDSATQKLVAMEPRAAR